MSGPRELLTAREYSVYEQRVILRASWTRTAERLGISIDNARATMRRVNHKLDKEKAA